MFPIASRLSVLSFAPIQQIEVFVLKIFPLAAENDAVDHLDTNVKRRVLILFFAADASAGYPLEEMWLVRLNQ